MTSVHTRNKLVQYLAYSGARRAPLRALLQTISEDLEDAAIFGGMIRDFGLGYARSFRSDIDIVTMSPASDIYQLVKRFNPTRNRFGGYRFSAAGRLFDIWCFFDTWAIQEGLIEGRSLNDLCKTTFFSLDAALFRLRDQHLVAAHDYEANLGKRILGVNLSRHPFPEKIAKRAIRMARTKNLSLSPDLCEFIASHLNSTYVEDSDAYFIHRLRSHLKATPDQVFTHQVQLSIWPSDEMPTSAKL